MGSRENIEQEKDEESGEIFNTMEELYSGRRYLGKERKFKKCRRIDRRVQTRRSRS